MLVFASLTHYCTACVRFPPNNDNDVLPRMPVHPTTLISCHECGLLQRTVSIAPGVTARCGRCGAGLYRARTNGIERSLMLIVSSFILFVLANSFPFMSFSVEGREQVSTLLTGVFVLYENGLWSLALVVFLASVALPLLKITLMAYVLLPLYLGRQPPHGALVFRWAEISRPWAMMEVFLLGVLVAYVKLGDLGTLKLGVSVFAFSALILVIVAADAVLDPHEVWERLALEDPQNLHAPGPDDMLVGCHACDLVNPVPAHDHGHHDCARCGAALHWRKTDSIARTWALVITAFILYIPANAYPIMTVISFGKGAPDTIISGVIHLIEAGLWPLALLVFVASIAVPMLKLVGLSYLLVSVQRGSVWRLKDKTVLYRIIEAVGRWSMIDIFMISILVALVNLGSVATIEPGVGAISFAAVVIITMIASMMFDPRLMWDNLEKRQKTDLVHAHG